MKRKLKIRIGITLLVIFVLSVFVSVLRIGYCLRLNVGSEALNAWGAYLTGCATMLIALAAIFGGSWAYSDYRIRAVAEKSRWVLQLHEKLFERSGLKEVRRKLDYGDTEEIKELIKADMEGRQFTPAEQGKFDDFTDYLNFFELIARLQIIGQLDNEDIKASFNYYLGLLTKKRNPEIREYLIKEGFENLGKLLTDEYETQD